MSSLLFVLSTSARRWLTQVWCSMSPFSVVMYENLSNGYVPNLASNASIIRSTYWKLTFPFGRYPVWTYTLMRGSVTTESEIVRYGATDIAIKYVDVGKSCDQCQVWFPPVESTDARRPFATTTLSSGTVAVRSTVALSQGRS